MSYSNLVGYCDQFIILPHTHLLPVPVSIHHHFKCSRVCKMKGSRIVCWFVLITALLPQIISWVSATSLSFVAVDHLPWSTSPALQPGSGLSPRAQEFQVPDAEDFNYKESKIGSSPPSCDGKCYGCNPCEPIQVPTITSRIGLQYANYEPEGWKCKCGPMFYSP